MIERAFVGRVRELATLDATFDASGAWVLLVEGPAGIGKTRLVAEFARHAIGRGTRVVSVLATEFEQATPLQLVHEIVEQMPEADPAAVVDVLTGADIRGLSRMLRQRLGARPTLLVVDDAQWVDTTSLRVLAGLLRTRPGAAFRVVLAYRDEQFPATLATGLRALGDATTHVRVPPLTATETAALLPEFSRPAVERLRAAAHGNPLYLLLLAEMNESCWDADDLPAAEGYYPALDRTLRAELEQLPEREHVVAQALAVCGPTTDLELIRATAELTRADVVGAIDELARRGWVSADSDRITFRHPLIRAAAYRLGGHCWRGQAHARAAQALRMAGAPTLRRARHLEHAMGGDDNHAVSDLLSAASEALATAPSDSVRWIEAALRRFDCDAARLADRAARSTSASRKGGTELDDHCHSDSPRSGRADDTRSSDRGDEPIAVWDRAQAELLYGRALLLTGAAEQAGAVLESLAREPGPSRAEALLLSARCERMLGRVHSARALLAAADEVSGSGAVQLELAILELQDNRPAHCAARVDALCGPHGTRDPAVRAAALAHRALGQVSGLRMALAAANYRVAEEDFTRLSDIELIDVVHGVAALGWAAYFLDEQRAGIGHIDRAIRVSRRFGRSFVLPELHLVRAYSLTKLGQLDEALVAADDAAESARLFRYPDVLAMAGAVKLRTLQLVSHRETVIAQWRELDAMPRPVVRWWRAVVDAALHEVGGLLGLVTDPAPIAAQDRTHPMQSTELAAQAHVALAHGLPNLALDLLERAETTAERTGLPGQNAAAALARAAWSTATGDLSAAEAAAHQAITGFSSAHMPVQRARALLFAAEIASRRDDFALATTRIATARQDFTRAGAHELATAATTLQRRLAGARTPTAATTLTGREREIADLAAHGHSNKHIAAHLHLSPRTVEDHLSRILRKLGLTGRAGIARRLAELDESRVS